MILTILLSIAAAFPTSIGFGEPVKTYINLKILHSQMDRLEERSPCENLISNSNVDTLKTYLVRMTEFPDRYYTTNNGLASALWTKDQISALQPQVSSDAVLTVRLFNHSWKQPSVIARYESRANSSASGDILITGCHFDTLAKGSPLGDSAPNPGMEIF